MTDYDEAPPMPVADYRHFQQVVPGLEGLYRSIRAIMDASLPDRAHIMIAGAGGGREIEALGASPRAFRMTGIDPSSDMLAIAQTYADALDMKQRIQLVKGTVEDADKNEAFDAATSILVMHFLADDGAKARYLQCIRERLKPGAPYLHADVSFDNRHMFDRIAPAIYEHALIVGLPVHVAEGPAHHIGRMAFGDGPPTIISEARTLDLFRKAGFRLVAPFFRGLWYAGWWMEAD
ncbi:MAG: class I SAM-dependent methyltransferase [Sphingomonadales bacterium]